VHVRNFAFCIFQFSFCIQDGRAERKHGQSLVPPNVAELKKLKCKMQNESLIGSKCEGRRKMVEVCVKANRPSVKSAASSPTALSNLFASLAMLATLFMPHSVGCNDQSVRPISLVTAVVSETDAIGILIFLWPYLFAVVTLLLIATLVLLRPPWFDKALLILPIGFSSLLGVCWAMMLFSGRSDSRAAMLIAAIIAPIAACVAARMFWLYRAGEITAAASWGQSLLCVLAAFSLRWFWYPPIKLLLWGGFVAIGSAILMMLASWTWMTRARYDLYDRSSEPIPFQVSLRQIIVAVAVVAIALTYWRAFGD
jgi:hypothetical protein